MAYESSDEEADLPTIPGNFSIKGISQICFNKDFTQCALCKKKKDIFIYDIGKIDDVTTWTLSKKLEDGHTQYVSGLDWSPATNRILSCSYDKSTIIWDLKNDEWIPSYLVATTKLGYLFASWNQRGDKIIAGTSEKKLFVGYFNEKSGWWSSKNIKGHKSSVCCAKIDPTSLFVLSGSTDLKVLVTSCYIPSIDDQFSTKDTKGLKQEFGQCVFKFDCSGWLNCVCWSPEGNIGFCSSQNANVLVIDYKNNKSEVIKLCHSPGKFLIPINDNSFYCVSYDKQIYLYEKGENGWLLKRKITQNEENVKANTLPVIPGKEEDQAKEYFIIEGPKNLHLHEAEISTATLKEDTIITTDFLGFVKFWKV